MSKTFNKNIQYTFNPQIILPTSSSLNVTSPTHTLGTLIISNSSTINYRPVRILSSSGSTLGAALHVNHNTLHPMSGSVTFNDSFGLRINGGNSGSGTTGCSWIFSQNGDLGLSLFLHQASTNTYSPTVGFTVNTIGNIGIGTTSPSANLEVSSSDLAILRLSGDNQDNALYDTDRLQTQIQLRSDNGNYGWNINHYNGTGLQAFGIEDVKNTTGNTRMYINNTGDIGFGTTTPSTSLHIYNSDPILRIQHNAGATSVNSGTLELVQSNLTGVRMRYDGASDVFLLQHLTSGVTQANGVFSSDGGNIGIRNSAPAYNLDVTGNFRTTGIIYSNDTTSVSVTANNYSTTSGSVNISGDIVIPGSNELMFTSTGVATPSLNGRSSGTKLVLYPDTNITRGDYSMGIETRNMWFQVPSSREGFKFYQGTSANFTIATNGNVGIGITSPSSDLHVNGSSRFGSLGSQYASIRSFTATLSTGAGNPSVVTTTVNYGVTYTNASKLVIQVTTSSIGVQDTFATSIRTIGTSSMVLNVVRIDATTAYSNSPTAHITIFELV
jgi:hypothetical protein